MMETDGHLLSPTGLTPTQKFWVSPGGDIVPLKGLWHYQWALGHAGDHGIDLGGETDEQPVRLRMLAGGWWRMNYTRKTCSLTVEGDVAGANAHVRGTVADFVRANARVLNRVTINLIDDGTCISSVVVDPSAKNLGQLGDAIECALKR